jgi:L-tartrate/succinate antiporter
MLQRAVAAVGEPRVVTAPAGHDWTRGTSPVGALLPLALGGLIAVLPVPDGLTPEAWHYFALFVTVIAAIVTEPFPSAALGMLGVVAAAVLGLVRQESAASAQWALSGFANPTVWLIFAGYVLTLGYSATGLGRRIALHLVRLLGGRTLGLGYAVTLSDLALAPFTASASARSAGTIYPIVRHIPELYGSRPGDGTARRIGAYLLYTALAASTITSSMFITALAPNTLAVSIIEQTTGTRVSWLTWFKGFAPIGCVLLLVVPAILYALYPPEIRTAPEAPRWAGEQLRLMGPMTRRELTLLALVCCALTLWISATHVIEPALTAVLVVLMMVMLRVVSWADVLGHTEAWNMLIWFGSLVTLAGGLGETGFAAWTAKALSPFVAGLGPYEAVIVIVGAFFFLHYFFASITAHTTTLLPVFLALAITIPGFSPITWALLLGYPLGLMSILTTYAAGQNVIYFGSGFISRRAFWTLGFVMGVIYLVVYLTMVVPWLEFLGM